MSVNDLFQSTRWSDIEDLIQSTNIGTEGLLELFYLSIQFRAPFELIHLIYLNLGDDASIIQNKIVLKSLYRHQGGHDKQDNTKSNNSSSFGDCSSRQWDEAERSKISEFLSSLLTCTSGSKNSVHGRAA